MEVEARLRRAARAGTGGARWGHARAPRQGNAFVELLATAPPPSAAGDPASFFEVVLPGGYQVRVAPAFDGRALGALLDVLEARR